MSVHVYGGGFLEYVDLEPQSFYYETDKNRDGDCEDEGDIDWYNGNTVTVTVSADATGSASVGIAYQVSHNRRRLFGPKTLLRISTRIVDPPEPTTPRPSNPPQDNNDQSQDNNNQPQDNNDQSQDNNNPPPKLRRQCPRYRT